jgi:hypothetical protein
LYFNLSSLVHITDFLVPWNFLHDRNIFCSDEVTLGGLLDEDWSPEKPSHDQNLGTLNTTSHPILWVGEKSGD